MYHADLKLWERPLKQWTPRQAGEVTMFDLYKAADMMLTGIDLYKAADMLTGRPTSDMRDL
jgi:hypothetical protein